MSGQESHAACLAKSNRYAGGRYTCTRAKGHDGEHSCGDDLVWDATGDGAGVIRHLPPEEVARRIAARGLRCWLRNYPWADEFGNAFGWSQESPRRLWFHLPFIGEFRVYRWGVELNLGPVLCFVALGFGTLGINARLVRGVW